MRQDEPLEFANAGALVAEAVAQSKRYAITQLDPTGVIQRFVSADVAGEVPLWAQLMREQGLEPGDRAVVLAGRDWEWRCALLGVLYAGGVAVPCPESTPAAELRAIEADAGAAFVVSIPARPDLVDQGGPRVVSADQLETVEAAKALAHRPHSPMPGDLGLILYGQRETGLQGTMHTHSSLIAQADAADHWLGLGEGERVWCTAADGSSDSIWLLLAAWRKGANIVTVDLPLDLDAQLELLEKLHPAVLWFSDEEYGALASAAPPAQVDLGSVRRALVDDESSAGAVAFEEAFGTRATPIVALDELGVVAGWPAEAEQDVVAGAVRPVPGIRLAIVDDHGTDLPAGQVGDVVVRGDAPSLFSGYTGGGSPRRDSWLQLGCRGALGADNSLRLASRPSFELELTEAEVDTSGAELVDDADLSAREEVPEEPEATTRPSRREAKRARRNEDREAKERQKAEGRKRRDEEKSRALAERAAAKERKEAERVGKSGRAQRREEKKARRREEQEAKEHRQAEERRRREEEKSSELAERTAAKEREETERAERKAAEVEERRRAKDEKRGGRKQRDEEKKTRRREEQQAKETARAQKKTARAEKRRGTKESQPPENGKRREKQRRQQADERAERERLAPETLSRISQYGLSVSPDEPSDAAGSTEPHPPGEPTEPDV